jgi:hypothetical protein
MSIETMSIETMSTETPFILQFAKPLATSNFAATEISTSGSTGHDGSTITDLARDTDHHSIEWGL